MNTNDAKICPVCGMVEPIENGVSLGDLFCPYSYEADIQVCAYPSGGYTLFVWSREGSAEIPLNFCPECGRDLRPKMESAEYDAKVIGNVYDNPERLPEYVPELLAEAET